MDSGVCINKSSKFAKGHGFCIYFSSKVCLGEMGTDSTV